MPQSFHKWQLSEIKFLQPNRVDYNVTVSQLCKEWNLLERNLLRLHNSSFIMQCNTMIIMIIKYICRNKFLKV